MEHRVSVVTSDDQERMIATLTAAFLIDLIMRWMLPDPQQYLEAFPPVLRALGRTACEHDTAFATADFSGVALWMPPGASADEEGSAELIDRWVEPDKQGELAEASEKTAECRPDDAWHLPIIGVDPFHQRRGIGAALLQHSLREIDAAGFPAYLETNPMSLSLYERHGFRSVGCVEVGSVPPIYPMLRPARSR